MNSFFLSFFIIVSGAAFLGYILSFISARAVIVFLKKQNNALQSENLQFKKDYENLKHHSNELERLKFKMEGQIASLKLKIERQELSRLQSRVDKNHID